MKKKNTLVAIALMLFLLLGVSFILPLITGSSQLLIVLSGSMHPVMRVGDMVVVNSIDANEIDVGDVICFTGPSDNPDIMITHRVMSMEEVDERVFQTKGDANEEQDDYTVPASKLVGEMVFVIPFAGYLPEASKNSMLFLVTIIIPAFVLIMDEVKNIIRSSNPVSARKMEREKRRPSRDMPHVLHGSILGTVAVISIVVLMVLVTPNIGNTGYTVLDEEYMFENDGYLSAVSVVTPEDPTQIIAIEPWYSVVPQKNESLVVTTSEPMNVGITSVPYVLPVLWVILLAQVDPYLPSVFIVIMYSSLAIVLSMPLWYRKARSRTNKKGMTVRRLTRSLRKLNLI